jgi:hypothetical protein
VHKQKWPIFVFLRKKNGTRKDNPKSPARTEGERAIIELPQHQDWRQMCPENVENPKN